MIPIENTPYLISTRKWVEKVVIGLHLCPFANVPFTKNQIRYALSTATSEQGLRQDFLAELAFLLQHDPAEMETSILVHPFCLEKFEDYWDFMAQAEEWIYTFGVEGEIQLASFHPEFRFEGTNNDDPENYTNRSPFPMIHLLREESVEWAVDHHPDSSAIPERNIELLRKMGLKEIQALRSACMK